MITLPMDDEEAHRIGEALLALPAFEWCVGMVDTDGWVCVGVDPLRWVDEDGEPLDTEGGLYGVPDLRCWSTIGGVYGLIADLVKGENYGVVVFADGHGSILRSSPYDVEGTRLASSRAPGIVAALRVAGLCAA